MYFSSYFIGEIKSTGGSKSTAGLVSGFLESAKNLTFFTDRCEISMH